MLAVTPSAWPCRPNDSARSQEAATLYRTARRSTEANQFRRQPKGDRRASPSPFGDIVVSCARTARLIDTKLALFSTIRLVAPTNRSCWETSTDADSSRRVLRPTFSVELGNITVSIVKLY